MKKASIKYAILVPTTIIVLIGMILVNAITGVRSSMKTEELTSQVLEETVTRYAYELKTQGDSAYLLSRSVVPMITSMRAHPEGRSQVIEALRQIIAENEEILGFWTAWESNAYDGQDAVYRNREYHDSTGRFAIQVYPSNGQVYVEPLKNLDDPVLGDYYHGVKAAGATYYTDPYVYPTDRGEIMVYTISVPILEDGRFVGAVGVDIDLSKMNEEFNAVRIMGEGYLLITNPNGIITTSPNADRRYKHYSEAKNVDFGPAIEKVMATGELTRAYDYSEYLRAPTVHTACGVQIGDSDRYWVVSGVVPRSVITASTRQLAVLISIIGLMTVAVCGIFLFTVVGRALRDLPLLTQSAQALAEGRVSQVHCEDSGRADTRNEVEILKNAFHSMVRTTQEQAGLVQRIAQGDLSVEIQPKSEDDLLNVALRDMLRSDNQVFHDIQESADVVNTGAMQISNSAQLLAQGTVEETTSMKQLSASAEDIASRAVQNEKLAQEAAELSGRVRAIADAGASKMKQMTDAVNEINQSTKSIDSVIRVIDDIAFQTNILALNAAVEAARAGQYGKGFAVVADEVRNLAGKSASAAKNTGAIITDTVKKAELGAQIADETAEILQEIVDTVNQSSDIVSRIPQTSREQTEAIEQINVGIQQVTQATQQNSTTAEESASISEELSGQARILRKLVSSFQLKENARKADLPTTPPPVPTSPPSTVESPPLVVHSAPPSHYMPAYFQGRENMPDLDFELDKTGFSLAEPESDMGLPLDDSKY